MLTLEALEALGSPLAARVELHEEIGSTQQRALDLAREGAPNGTLVVSKVQTGGRGRLERRWGSPSGGLWMSVVLRLDLALRLASRVTPAAAVGVAKALRGFGVDARIKWPNDILVGGAGGNKICGILAESGGRPPGNFIVLGVGVNANVDPRDLEAPLRNVTTMRSELGHDVDLLELLEAVLSKLDFELSRLHDFAFVLDDWRALDCTIGRRVRVQRFGEVVEGTAADLGPEGQLVIRTQTDAVEIFEGDVEHLRQQDS
ncbi:MAG: biotin--[acetyl-CoA-carboxylase] ligase [Rubrobacter sp.]|nr:biotin--[acetyl-CoA-carboxylase] ligase [Rubrobacter sp.]